MRKKIKSAVSILIAATMIFSMSACEKSSSKNARDNSDTSFIEDEVVEGSRLQADWIDTAIIYEVNVRQYTEEGTFEAFSEHLDRLKELGVNTLWFMPVYSISQVNKKGTLGSYYSISDYKNINEEFGTLEEFKELVNKAHDMGFTVILDWVANHTGWDHVWIEEHPEYYVKDEDGDIIFPLNTDWTDVAQLDYSNDDMRAAMIDAMKFWVEEVGIDGFRCDYAQGVPVDFWESAREELDKVKPVYMLAEDGTSSNSMLNKAFDSDYNFALYDALKLSSAIPNSADEVEDYISIELPYGAFRMNFIDNHDKNTYDGTLKQRFGDESLGALYTVVFTGEGIPLIYSGNEEDTDISLEFFEKDNIDFGDYRYADLLGELCKIRKENEPLYSGTSGGKVRIIKDDNMNVTAFERVKNGKKITVVVNLSGNEQNVKYEQTISDGEILLHGDAEGMKEMTDTKLNKSDLNLLSPWEYYIIVSQ